MFRPSPPGLPGSQSDRLRWAAKAARARQQERQRQQLLHGPGPTGHQHPEVEEHYHIIYHVPKHNLAIPYFKEVFLTPREAYLKIHHLGTQAEPNTEWYEEGAVGFETRMPGRTGLFWVVVEITGCIRKACSQFMTKSQRKRQLSVIPMDGDPVPTEVNLPAIQVLNPEDTDGYR